MDDIVTVARLAEYHNNDGVFKISTTCVECRERVQKRRDAVADEAGVSGRFVECNAVVTPSKRSAPTPDEPQSSKRNVQRPKPSGPDGSVSVAFERRSTGLSETASSASGYAGNRTGRPWVPAPSEVTWHGPPSVSVVSDDRLAFQFPRAPGPPADPLMRRISVPMAADGPRGPPPATPFFPRGAEQRAGHDDERLDSGAYFSADTKR